MCRIISRPTPLPSVPVQLTGFIPSALSLPGGIRCLWISLNQMFSSELILRVTLSWFLAPLFRQAPRRQCLPSLGSSWRPGWSFLKSMLCSNALSNLKKPCDSHSLNSVVDQFDLARGKEKGERKNGKWKRKEGKKEGRERSLFWCAEFVKWPFSGLCDSFHVHKGQDNTKTQVFRELTLKTGRSASLSDLAFKVQCASQDQARDVEVWQGSEWLVWRRIKHPTKE